MWLWRRRVRFGFGFGFGFIAIGFIAIGFIGFVFKDLDALDGLPAFATKLVPYHFGVATYDGDSYLIFVFIEHLISNFYKEKDTSFNWILTHS